MATVLVTGAAGFIGSHLCRRLLALNHVVLGIDNFDPFYERGLKEKNLQALRGHPHFHFYEADITQSDAFSVLDDQPVSCVVHLASKAGVLPSLKNPAGYLTTNIAGTQHLLEYMKCRHIRKFIFASSSSVYGNNEKIPFSEEDATDHPISPYGFSKKACELLSYTYHHLYGIDVVNLRFFTVYGPGQRPDLAIHKFFKLAYAGKPIGIYGDGTTARDYTFIDDTVAGTTAALEYVLNHNQVYEIINLGNNKPVQLLKLVHSIYEVTDTKPILEHFPMQAGDVNITYADIRKAERMLNYKPQTALHEGLRRFNEWFKAIYSIS